MYSQFRIMSVRPGNNNRKLDFQAIRNELLLANSLYVDREFQPNNGSLTFNGQVPVGLRNVIWKRPKDLATNPKFIVKGARRYDLDQGYIGNCWFIAGASLISQHKKLLERVVPHDQDFDQNYAGIFRFNFWWYGKWIEVIVDDYLPTDGYRLIYAKNREEPNEFWAPLLEKAYAKLHGCYQALDGGKLNDAIVDMTGCISERIDLSDKSKIPANLYDILWKSFKMNSLFGASIHLPKGATTREAEKPNGLYMGHAYSITGLATVPYQGTSVQLLRMLNPWGEKEWRGDWSDKSPQIRNMSQDVRRQLGIEIVNEGEFWISVHDMIANFDEIQLAHQQPDALSQEIANDERKQQWKVTVYHDAWIKGVTAGGCGMENRELYWRNPQFRITVTDPDEHDNRNLCTLIINLMEKETASSKNKIAMGFDLYKLRNPQNYPLDSESAPRNALVLTKRTQTFEYYREMTRRYEVEPGVYVVIPSTFHPHEEAEFMIRFYTEKPIESSVLDENPGPVSTTFVCCNYPKLFFDKLKRNTSGTLTFEDTETVWKVVKKYKAVFKQFDMDGSGNVDTYELGKMFATLGFPISRQVQTSMVRRYGGKNSRISLPDFIVVVCKIITMYNIFQDQHKKGGPEMEELTAKFTLNEFLYYTMYC
ncbi:hypothetical protein KUTeg_004243 [Tegillarca granosa]|uniref:Uncharacterized protein n=1 Tax=Tegillarca granosa TaxID=220873 RepID=A0ABQ9FT45_TEGGR|nr:hypothetical protein KUTeg_004243 [Tegillarca granosa]